MDGSSGVNTDVHYRVQQEQGNYRAPFTHAFLLQKYIPHTCTFVTEYEWQNIIEFYNVIQKSE